VTYAEEEYNQQALRLAVFAGKNYALIAGLPFPEYLGSILIPGIR